MCHFAKSCNDFLPSKFFLRLHVMNITTSMYRFCSLTLARDHSTLSVHRSSETTTLVSGIEVMDRPIWTGFIVCMIQTERSHFLWCSLGTELYSKKVKNIAERTISWKPHWVCKCYKYFYIKLFMSKKKQEHHCLCFRKWTNGLGRRNVVSEYKK